MFFAAQRAPSSAAAELRQLRQSLNTPVVSIAQLPVGPASAAIAVHETSGEGGACFTVAVRCQETQNVAFFAASADADWDEPCLAGDAALSLAEGMGFLFDDWIAMEDPAAREVANRLWGQFVDAAESPAVVNGPSTSALSASTETSASDTASGLSLTKFRRDLPWGTPRIAHTDSDLQLAG
jgi:hypothetical protein